MALSHEVKAEDVFLQIYEVESICDIKWNPATKRLEALIQWSGFDILEGTWQAFTTAYADVPELIMLYVDNLDDSLLKRKIMKTIDALDAKSTKTANGKAAKPSKAKRRKTK